MAFTHTELCYIGEKYLRNYQGCTFTAVELVATSNEIPDVVGWKENTTMLLEAKTSKSDFIADKNKFSRNNPDFGIGNYRYYICEEGLINIEELPDKWGLIWVNSKKKCKLICGKNCNGLEPIKGDYTFTSYFYHERALMFSMLRRAYKAGIGRNGKWDSNEYNKLKIENKLLKSTVDEFRMEAYYERMEKEKLQKTIKE